MLRAQSVFRLPYMLMNWLGLPRIGGTHSAGTRRRVRGALLVAFAIVALSLQALRPICDVLLIGSGNAAGGLFSAHVADAPAHSAHGLGGSDVCCSSIEEVAVPPSLAVMPAPLMGGTPLVLSATFLPLAGFGFLPFGALRFAGAPPKTRRYHARSARILR